jgi:hypothetical protein
MYMNINNMYIFIPIGVCICYVHNTFYIGIYIYILQYYNNMYDINA